MLRDVRRLRLLDLGVSLATVIIIGGIVAGWYLLGQTARLTGTPVGGDTVEVGVGVGSQVEFTAPDGSARIATGDPMLGRLVTSDGRQLLVRITPGVTDFDGAAPRRLRELKAMGVTAEYTEPLRTSVFSGRMCRAEARGLAGTCAFVVRDEIGVTVVALPGRTGTQMDLPKLIDGMRVG